MPHNRWGYFYKMAEKFRSPNFTDITWAQNSITGKAEYVTSTNNKLDVNATASLAGSSIPITGATTAVGVAIVDGSGNQITSFGGGTQYTQGGSTVANPTGTAEIWFDVSGNPKAVTPTQPLPSNISDGSNSANVLVGDSGYNGVLTGSATKTLTFTTSSSGIQTILPNTNVEGYSWIEIAFTSIGVGLALTGQFSTASGGTYVNANTFSDNANSPVNALGNSLSTNRIYFSSIHGNFFQIAVSALTSGTFSGTVTLRATPPPYASISVGSNSATGSAVPANAFYVGGNASGNLRGIALDLGDTAGAGSGFQAENLFLFNGTSYDRTRSASASAGTSGTGLLGVGALGFDGSNYQRMFTANGAANSVGTGLLGVGNLGYDGTNWQSMGVAAANASTTGVSGISQLVSGTGFTTATLTLNSGAPNTAWFDMLNYSWVSVEILTNTTPATLTFQTSGDSAQTNVRGMPMVDSQSTGAAQGFSLTTSSTTGTFHGPRVGRYFRISSNNGAGTTTLVITFFTNVSSLLSVQSALSVVASNATGSAVPGGAFFVGIQNGAGNLTGLSAVSNIPDANAGNGSASVGVQLYNGSTYDKLRSATSAANTTGTGLLGAGALMFDGTNYQLMHTTAGDAANSNVLLDTKSLIYNGTNYDRTRSATSASNTTGTGLLGTGSLGIAATALPSAATATNYAVEMTDKFGRQVVLPNAMRDLILPFTLLTLTASTAETTLITGVASTFNDILSIVVINTSATATRVDFRDSTAGTIRTSLYIPGGDTRGFTLTTPLPQNTAAGNWTAQSSVSVTSIVITGTYVTNK